MSNTFEMNCHNCKEAYWFGQTNSGDPYMYKSKPFMDWLVEHSGHKLEVTSEYSDKCYDYKQISYDGEQ